MKKVTAIIAVILLLTVFLCGCKNVNEPDVSPNVPVVSESPAIPSPDLTESPAVGSPGANGAQGGNGTQGGNESPASPGMKQPATSPATSPSA